MAEGKDIVKYADAAMYDAQPILREEGARVTPRVFLLSATPDPLGSLAIDMRMYRGDPVYSASEITDDERRWAWDELSKTRLNTPLEGVQMKFMIEAVTRSFTHQMVRQRVGAYYVQESLRFAVKKGIAQESALPPSILSPQEAGGLMVGGIHTMPGMEAHDVWHDTINAIEEAYGKLIALGIPAEDARGLLPHCVTTRLLYTTNLRALFEHAGNRLCTQAQFEWRAVFMGIMQAMRSYGIKWRPKYEGAPAATWRATESDAWQWQIIAQPTPKTFAPVCYKTGKCEFMASLDRGCSIRERVMKFHERGVPPEDWGIPVHHFPPTVTADEEYVPVHTEGETINGIDPAEWMANPLAGVTTETNRPQ